MEWSGVVVLLTCQKLMSTSNDPQALTTRKDAPVNTVRRFLHLLDQSEIDFAEELRVNNLKENVVTNIKRNKALSEASATLSRQ